MAAPPAAPSPPGAILILRAALAVVLTLPLATPGPATAAAPAAPEGPRTVADVYRYLEDPRLTGEGQEPPHADLRPYAGVRAAAADVTEHAAKDPNVTSLNGGWRL